MKVIYNNKIVFENDIKFSKTQRGMVYGDGLFETMICKEGTVKYLDKHLARLHKGMEVLGMIPDETFEEANILDNIHKLLDANEAKYPTARIRLIVWRKNGGYFTPVDNGCESLISCSEQVINTQTGIEAALSERIFLSPSPYSGFKTLNMLPYVLAGIEKQKRGLSELVLLNNTGHVTEASSSNIFWIKNNKYFTPSLDTGCIAGIMREVIMEKLTALGKEVHEVKEPPEALREADAVFMSNVTGIRFLHKFEGKIFKEETSNSFLKTIF